MPQPLPLLKRFSATLAILLAAGCASTPADDGAALAQRRAEATRLAIRAGEAQSAGKIDESIELYHKSIETYGEIPGVRTNLAVALLANKDLLGATDTLKAEIQLFPAASQQALTNLGVIYLNGGWGKEALDYFERALEIAPNDPVALRGAIDAMIRNNKSEEDTLQLVKRAWLVEKDPKVLAHYRWLQIEFETKIKDRPRYGNHPPDSRRPGAEQPPSAASSPEANPQTPPQLAPQPAPQPKDPKSDPKP